jgi:hypothetical protein
MHTRREELILFPAIAECEATGGETVPFCCIEDPIARIEHEHESTSRVLAQMRQFTRDYTIPVQAGNTHRALFAALIELETDLHQHIHLENNILFPGRKTADSLKLSSGDYPEGPRCRSKSATRFLRRISVNNAIAALSSAVEDIQQNYLTLRHRLIRIWMIRGPCR